MTDEIREALQEKANLDPEKTKIVDMRFSFYNKEMLRLLENRAEKLMSGKFDKVSGVEADMDFTKETQFDEMRTPNTFYVTFESSAAATAFKRLIKLEWRHNKLSLEEPVEPSDIQWVNRGLKYQSHIVRFILVFLLGIAGNFAVILSAFIVSMDWQLYFSYSEAAPGINCNVVEQQWGDKI